MKLFLATNEKTAETHLIKMLEVSVNSALQNTDFEIFVLFDGDKKKLNLSKEVTIIEHKHRCFETFKNSIRCRNSELCLTTASGAFLRTEIPYIMKTYGFDDKFCLYTDYDVIFQKGDYSFIKNLQPSIFAAAPESIQTNWSHINTGVMVMNIDFFFERDKMILDYINQNFEYLQTWDQSLYNNLYKNQFTKLPIEFNWKPYWGKNVDAKIIHFHGVKPFSINSKETMDPILFPLYSKNPESYDYYSEIFKKFL